MKNITIKQVAFSTLAISIFTAGGASQVSKNVLHMPNVVFVLADEWRAQAAGFNGNKDVQTPNLDRLADRAVNFTNTISGCPVCTPYRGSLLTGQYPLTTGVFVNDVQLNPETPSLAKVFKAAGYQTAYIGKWHLDGHGRNSFIPVDRRQGFEYWKVLECTHDYNNSYYWGNGDKKAKWEGYDAFAQTADAANYIRERKQADKPFFMLLSWGPPHTPFETAPESYKQKYRNKSLKLRANVPSDLKDKATNDLVGYYAHISALDSCIGVLQKTLIETGLDENTIFIFTADHGAMVRSHGFSHKQVPYEESIHVPMLIRYPAVFGNKGKKEDMLITTTDLMPTLLALCGLPIPKTVEGADRSPVMKGKQEDKTDAVLIACYEAFGQWTYGMGGKEYRGVRTKRYTYVKDLKGPWLLFDNLKDPFQLKNLVKDQKSQKTREGLELKLTQLLKKINDQFLPGQEYIKKWGYVTDKTGTVPYVKINYQGLPIE
ncbi:MAG: sulfatase [Bacteroidetes bacterium]|nr:sulfatase [Bacteroidota bacterium]